VAVPPRTRQVSWYEAPSMFTIDIKPGFPEKMSEIAVTKRTENLPVQRVTGRGRDVVRLPNGEELELP
jgi:hypothetical protein